MIAARHLWLLRDATTLFDSADPRRCRICRLQEKGEVLVPLAQRERHLAAHRREKVDRERNPLPEETVA